MSANKVYGYTSMRDGVQTREIVMTTSWTRAAALMDVAVSFLRKYGSTSENSEEWEIARRYPGVVCWRPLDGSRKVGTGWLLNNGDPITIEFNEGHAELLAAALSRVKRVQADVDRGDGWAELYNVELWILSSATALGIPQAEITERVHA